ncbi:MAG: hypothetical protein Q9159_004316 [Coniocarpon cinnabarinum]
MDIASIYLEIVLKDAATDQMHDFVVPSVGNYGMDEAFRNESELQFDNRVLRARNSGLQICRQSLSAFQRHAEPARRLSHEAFALTIEDLNMVIREGTLQAKAQQDVLQSMASSAATRQARQSLQETSSTRRLGVIACIFLPLNFATSFLGMNLKQFNGGSIGLGWFFTLALVAGMLCALIIYVNPSVETAWQQARVNAAHDEGWYEEEQYYNVSPVRVVQLYAQAAFKRWKGWWRMHITPRIARARRPPDTPV